MSCLLIYMLSAAKDQRETEIRTTVENVALLLDLSISEAVGKIDLSLHATADELAEQLRRHAGLDDLDVNALLEGRRKWVSAFRPTLRVTDASGAVLYCAGCVMENEASLADRDFFAAHHDRKDSGLIVSNPSVDRLSNDWVISFTRRYDGPDGRFAGVISASVPTSAFARLYSKIDLGPHGVAALRDANMALVARVPPSADQSPRIGSKLYSPELADIIASGDATRTYHAARAGTGVERTLAYRRLSAMPLHLVVGMGTDDYLTEWRSLIGKAVAVAALFLAGSTFLAGLLWRSSRLAKEANERSHLLLRNASDGIHILDLQHNVIEVSDAFCRMLGYSSAEMIGMNASTWDARFVSGVPVDFKAKAGGKFDILTFETPFRRKDDSCLDAEITVRPLELAGQKLFFCSARDISRRKAAEARNQRLSNLYAALSQCNQAIVHCANEAELFSKICHCAVEYGLVKTAWIGFVDEASKRVNPVAWCGDGRDLGFPEHIPVVSVDASDPYGRGLTGTAIRCNQPQWSQDFLRDPITAPWHEYGQKAGWRSSATLP
ncbi:MAG TPA: PAS domain S-box protein, partial [Telmatospirillum sp.]|nr:PAS domain S-box protein [Telmatospirillum sp.]